MAERLRLLRHCADALAQAGLVARGGILVQRTFLNGLVECGDGLAIGLLGRGLVSLGDDLAQVAQLRAQGGSVGAVARRAAFGLAGALERRKMVCHVWFFTFVCSARCSGWVRINHYRGAARGRSNVGVPSLTLIRAAIRSLILYHIFPNETGMESISGPCSSSAEKSEFLFIPNSIKPNVLGAVLVKILRFLA